MAGDQAAVGQILDKDKRFLTKPLKGQTILLSLALEQKPDSKSLEVLKFALDRLGDQLGYLPEAKADHEEQLFRQVTRFGFEAALRVGQKLHWESQDYQKQYWYGIDQNDPMLLKVCLECKANPDDLREGRKAIHWVAEKEQKELIRLLSEYKQIDNVDEEGYTALHQAIIRNRLSEVKLLIEHKADVQKVSENSKKVSPLELSIEQIQTPHDSLEIIEFLLKKKANPNIQDKEGYPLLSKVLRTPHKAQKKAILTLLIRYNADAALVGPHGERAIFEAFRCYGEGLKEEKEGKAAKESKEAKEPSNSGDEEWEKRSEENESDQKGSAKENRNKNKEDLAELLDLLAIGGADLEVKDEKDEQQLTPLLKAVSLGQEEAVSVLLHHGANTKATDRAGNTALHLAADQGLETIVDILLKHEVDTTIRNSAGHTASLVAVQKAKKAQQPDQKSRYYEIDKRIKEAGINQQMNPLRKKIEALREENQDLRQELKEVKKLQTGMNAPAEGQAEEKEENMDWQAKAEREFTSIVYEKARAIVETAQNILGREMKPVSVYKAAKAISKEESLFSVSGGFCNEKDIFASFCSEQECLLIESSYQKFSSGQRAALEQIRFFHPDKENVINSLKIIKSIYSGLSYLALNGNKIGAEGAKILDIVLPNSRITYLDLNWNQIGAEGVKSLSAVLLRSRIAQLSLYNNKIGDKGAESLAAALPQSKITYLDLNWNQIGAEGAKSLAASLPKSKITHLNLHYNKIGDEGAESLAAALPQSRVIQLNVNYNRVGEEGAKSLATTLPQSRIAHLCLENNKLGEKGAKSLAAALHQPRITHLNLNSNEIGDKGAKSLATALRQSGITHLNLSYNKIGGEGVKSLAAALSQSKITYLSVGNNHMGDEARNCLLEAVAEIGLNGRLIAVDVFSAKEVSEAMERIIGQRKRQEPQPAAATSLEQSSAAFFSSSTSSSSSSSLSSSSSAAASNSRSVTMSSGPS